MARQHEDKAGTPQKSRRRTLLSLWRADKKAGRSSGCSLKGYARELQAGGNDQSLIADAWLSNKRLNPSAPPQKIGRTRKGKGTAKKG